MLDLSSINRKGTSALPGRDWQHAFFLTILPEQSKIIEREAFNQLLEFLEAHELLDPRQACYSRGHSTKTALTAVIEDIRYAIEESKITILILFDFSKAFDFILHQRLLQKLRTHYLSNHNFLGKVVIRCASGQYTRPSSLCALHK